MMKRTLLLTAVMGMVALLSGAQDRGTRDRAVKSAVVKQAILKRDRAVEQADASYRKASFEANKALLVELKKAKDAALAAKNLDEANAIAGLTAVTEQEVEQGAGNRARRARPRLAIDPTKGTWVESSGSRGTYRTDGTVRFDVWAADGRWEAVGPHTIVQHESNGLKSTVTFTADGQHALWVFSERGVTWARRAE